jgi:hypothetical protein
MRACLILPERTEIGAITDTLQTAMELETIEPGGVIDRQADSLFIDLTFDLYRRDVSVSWLYSEVGRIASMLEHYDTRDLRIYVLRGYPFRSNSRALLFRQRVLSDFCHALAEFHQARAVLVPTVISRQSFLSAQNPCVLIINAVRQDTATKVGLREDSRFRLIYEMDLLDALAGGSLTPGNVPLAVEGAEISLRDVYEGASRAAGNTPVTWDSKNFVHYDYPEGNFDTVSNLRYSFGDMMVDLISYLF